MPDPQALAAALMGDDQSPWERAAARIRASVKPEGGRQEGLATALLDAVGTDVYNTAARPSRMINGLVGEQPGALTNGLRPDIEAQVPALALDLVGVPGVTGGIPADALGSAAKGIRAYHGSPHDFDRFDLSKIGTGEGAQAYGHGLYFAENPAVAKQYKDDLTGMRVSAATRALGQAGGDVDAAIGNVRTEIDRLKNLPNAGNDPIQRDRFIAIQEEKLSELNALKNNGAMSRGRMYEVNINAHPDQFLDWDKPLSQQAAASQANGVYPVGSGGQSGSEFYQALIRDLQQGGYKAPKANSGESYADWSARRSGVSERDPSLASAVLKDAGVPGIKYLDQGSRQTSGGELIDVFKDTDGWKSKIRMNRPNGEQYFTTSMPLSSRDAAEQWAQGKIGKQATNNYVLFDDKIIDILKKYGIAGLSPAALGSLLSAQQPEQPSQ